MSYGIKGISEEKVVEVLTVDDPPAEVFILRKKLLRYTKSLSEMDRDKYENDLFYI